MAISKQYALIFLSVVAIQAGLFFKANSKMCHQASHSWVCGLRRLSLSPLSCSNRRWGCVFLAWLGGKQSSWGCKAGPERLTAPYHPHPATHTHTLFPLLPLKSPCSPNRKGFLRVVQGCGRENKLDMLFSKRMWSVIAQLQQRISNSKCTDQTNNPHLINNE